MSICLSRGMKCTVPCLPKTCYRQAAAVLHKAGMCIKVDKTLHKNIAPQEGGWEGWRVGCHILKGAYIVCFDSVWPDYIPS